MAGPLLCRLRLFRLVWQALDPDGRASPRMVPCHGKLLLRSLEAESRSQRGVVLLTLEVQPAVLQRGDHMAGHHRDTLGAENGP